MAPFLRPASILSGIKEKIDSLTIQGDRLYLGSSVGNLHVYSFNASDDGNPTVELVETKKSLVRRSIEQLGYIKDVNSLVVLSEMNVTLFPLPSCGPPTLLVKAKAAFSFAVHTSVQERFPEGSGDDFSKAKPVPTVVTQLLVGCRRKAVIYSWRDGEPEEPKEAPLPHSARIISFLDHNTACFAYSPTDYAMFSLSTMTATDITTPLPMATSASVGAMGAFTGLTGYMTLGLGAKAKPGVVSINETEALIAKDGNGHVVDAEGKVTRSPAVEWPAPPEELAFVKPYIFTILPPNTVPTRPIEQQPTSTSPGQASGAPPAPNFIPTSVLQIRSALSFQVMQTTPFPFNISPSSSSLSVATTAGVQNATIRLLTPSTKSGNSSIYFLTTPIDRTAATNEGSTIWQCIMKPWDEQIDELVLEGLYSDALALLDNIDDSIISDKETRRTRIRALNAVADFRDDKFDQAIDTLIELDLNPAKVLALYPEPVAGRLSVPSERWIPLFGGPSPPEPQPEPEGESSSTKDGTDAESTQQEIKPEGEGSQPQQEATGGTLLNSIAGSSVAESLRGRLGQGLGTGLSAGLGAMMRSANPAAIAAREGSVPPAATLSKPAKPAPNTFNQAVETLVRYVTDRRPKFKAALAAVGITPDNQAHNVPPLSEVPVEELFALPNAPLSALTPEQLLRCAQIVDTALYKSYLIVRPALLGHLCRLPNWCEMSEVEEDLRARKKFAEMIDLYQGKKMHAQALGLLRQLGEEQSDMEDRLTPTIRYLQKLGPEYLHQIFDSARWVFDSDANLAFDIFTSEDVELPRQDVCDYLINIDPKIGARYLEYLIEERNEERREFHDRLAELYFNMTISARKRGDEEAREEVYNKLLHFIDTDELYSVDRLYAILSSDLYEARAILLGRLGRHDQALELYVYRMHNYLKAEEYCKRFYHPGTDTKNIFLTLLRIYLRPTIKTSTDLLTPALELMARHNPRLDPVETLQLLPPLVPAKDVRSFLIEALRAPLFDTAVVRSVSKAENDQSARKLMALQMRRVKVTDSRICPLCHKRIGNSVIAVHAPRGEVTHYQCREAFARRISGNRRFLEPKPVESTKLSLVD